nr:MAG TPA: hypothetical protein [Caudoviricetes sp.]
MNYKTSSHPCRISSEYDYILYTHRFVGRSLLRFFCHQSLLTYLVSCNPFKNKKPHDVRPL